MLKIMVLMQSHHFFEMVNLQTYKVSRFAQFLVKISNIHDTKIID